MLLMLTVAPLNKIKTNHELTKRFRVFTGYTCNIKCVFCFYSNKPIKDINEQIYEQLNQGRMFGMKDVDLSGGEPTILPYWFDIIKAAKYLGYRTICVITNGYKFANKDFLKKSIDLGLNDILFSLHGYNSQVHDGLTGVHNSFNKVMVAINNAKELGVNFRINTVVSKYNYKMLPYLADVINDAQPTHMNFLPFRIETNADPDNLAKFSDTIPYVKEAIDILDDNIEINVRYVPFCMMDFYEQYVNTYVQRMFDIYEWSEYLFSKMDPVRDKGELLPIDFETNRSELELEAMTNTIKDVCEKITPCLTCGCKWICEGVWKSYINCFGSDEFSPVLMDDTYDPLHFKGNL